MRDYRGFCKTYDKILKGFKFVSKKKVKRIDELRG